MQLAALADLIHWGVGRISIIEARAIKVANFAAALREEIIRLVRKELRFETAGLKKAVGRYRSEIANLKKRLTAVEQQLSRRRKGNSQAAVAHDAERPASKTRFSAKGFRSMRDRLDLSGPEVAELLRVSVQTVYNWEAGTSRPREPQLSAIGVLRKTGKRELAARLNAAAK